MMHKDSDAHPVHHGRGPAPGSDPVTSVLCVHASPIFLDRLCRHLEQQGDISVDILTSVEDALHLIRYVHFDIIVTDYDLAKMEKISFVDRIRQQGNKVPLIFLIDDPNDEINAEYRSYASVYLVVLNDESLSQGFNELYHVIKKLVH
jgi:CheY-like chemotaxis protein